MVRETFESLVIAFILAFIFRSFVVEAFVIPTGSMADTLRGAHFRLICPRCANRYNFGFDSRKYFYSNKGYVPPVPIQLIPDRLRHSVSNPICPLCGSGAENSYPQWVSNGDRILVLKYLYQFTEPKIWDVVVFKNPTDPMRENFIKRLVGRPGEKVEIIDGDIYINDFVQRKPQYIQDELWLLCFDNNHQPDIESQTDSQNSTWPVPFRAADNEDAWRIDQKSRIYEFTGSEKTESLIFDENRLRRIANFCAYNGYGHVQNFIASDLKMSFEFIPTGQQGNVSIRLGKYGRVYNGTVNFDGKCTISDMSTGTILTQGQLPALKPGRPVQVAFSNVDHRLQIQIGDNFVTYDGPSDPLEWGYQPGDFAKLPTIALYGQGNSFTIKGLRIYRDIHYTSIGYSGAGRGTEGNPILLNDDEFFVLGDNSPASHDSRFWESAGKGNGHTQYRTGIVPRDYLIGKAFFVYWPGGFRFNRNIKFPFIPNVGDIRFIH